MRGENEIYEKYVSEICAYPRIDYAREAKLSQIIRKSKSTKKIDKAVTELVHANLKLVLHCLKDFSNYLSSPDVTLTQMDLISEGNIALVAAARHFNSSFRTERKGSKGTHFSTYACRCIRSRMQRTIKLSYLIHIPERHFSERKKLDMVSRQHDRQLSDAELSNLSGFSETRINMINLGRSCRVSWIEDMNLNSDTPSTIEMLPDRSNAEPDRLAANNDLMQFVYSQFDYLKPRTREMISELYLSGNRTTLQDLSEKFGVSKERCRQICAAGLHKLRDLIESKKDNTTFDLRDMLTPTPCSMPLPVMAESIRMLPDTMKPEEPMVNVA